MSLNTEWRSRINSWINALEKLVYVRCGSVQLEVFYTYDQLTPEQANGRHFTPIAPGTAWGRKWEYAWLRGKVQVPADLHGQSLFIKAGDPTPQFGGDCYGEWRVLIDGVEIGSRDWAHVFLPLPRKEQSNSLSYDILAEAFGGPSRAGAGGGPALFGVPTLPEPPELQRVLPDVTFGLWREEVYQLILDARTLFDLRDQLPPTSLRVSEIDNGLKDFTLIADPELDWPQMQPTIHAARERLRPLLECTNGSTVPTLFCVGHSHLDIVYQWPLAEAERKVARTFGNQLALLEQYPEYRYLQSMPVLYDIAKRLHPTIYKKVKTAVTKGQWLPDGGMWTEADVNLPSGESLIRQFVYGRRFFAEEFGIDSQFAWMPDTFGFSGSLPQIMIGCGMTSFASSKIFCVFSEDADPFPYSSFWWEGIDGTRILSHFILHYGIATNPKEIHQQWEQNPQKDSQKTRMIVYGHSDGGGGCERAHLEYLRRQADLEGSPRCRHATPQDFFDNLRQQADTLPTYNGEIYLAAHRGVYTSQAALKYWNRKCEFMLREAELWNAATTLLNGVSYPATAIEDAWKKTLFNQFHDILPGSCINRAAQEASALYEESYKEADTLATSARSGIAASASATDAAAATRAPVETPSAASNSNHTTKALATSPENARAKADTSSAFTVFNSLSWDRQELVRLPDGVTAPSDVQTQIIEQAHYVEAVAPSCGWAGSAEACSPSSDKASDALRATSPYTFENEAYLIELDRTGSITRWFDKQASLELAAGPLNQFCLYRDTPHVCDAWEIAQHYTQQPVNLDDEASIELIAAGPLAIVIRVRRKLHDSLLEQDIWLKRGSRRLEFHTRIHWNEKHKLLKVAFPLAIHSSEALHEIQFGHVARPTHRSRKVDQDRFEVCQQKWSALTEERRGIAVLNDCKYGISAEGNTLSLTLLKSAQAPDMHADQGVHTFSYALYAWNCPFSESDVIREAMALNAPLSLTVGTSAQARSLFGCDAQNIIIEHVKMGEENSGKLVLRLYESSRTTTRCNLSMSFNIHSAHESDMLENPVRELPHGNHSIALHFRPFEIKTLVLSVSP